MTTKNDFTLWLEHIQDHKFSTGEPRRTWCRKVIELLLNAGWRFVGKPTHIIDGRTLQWRKEHAFIILQRDMRHCFQDEQIGVAISDENESYECSFSVLAPIEVIKEAIDWLIPENE